MLARLLAFAFALAATALAAPASAKNWPDAGGWSIVQADDFCLMTMEFEGPGESKLVVLLHESGKLLVTDLNYDWSAKQDEKYPDVSFDIGGNVYSGTATGMEFQGRKGFSVGFLSDVDTVIDEFSRAGYLHIYKGEQRIDRLSLDGSGAGLAMTRRCLAEVRRLNAASRAREAREAAAEAREKARYADLPKDPFAKQ